MFVRILGAGITGACLAEACAKRNLDFEVVDPNGVGNGASGNPMAVVEPRIIVKGTLEADFRICSFLFAQNFYDTLANTHEKKIWLMRGVRQSSSLAYSQKRLDKIAAGFKQPYPDWFDVDGDNLLFPTGGAVDTRAILTACFDKTTVLSEPSDKNASVVIYATGPSFLPQDFSEDLLPIIPNRGVVSYFDKRNLKEVMCGAGYAIENQQNMFCGANYLRWMDLTDHSWANVEPKDHEHNQLQAMELLGDDPGPAQNGRASLRSTTPDRMPLVGICNKDTSGPAKFLCIGFGSRGYTYAPIVADHLISHINEEQGPLPDALWQLMSPARFNSRIQGTY